MEMNSTRIPMGFKIALTATIICMAVGLYVLWPLIRVPSGSSIHPIAQFAFATFISIGSFIVSLISGIVALRSSSEKKWGFFSLVLAITPHLVFRGFISVVASMNSLKFD